jgi:hypothetical protein
MAKKVVELQPETQNGKYLRWVRVLVSVLTFGMVFPNAMTERMERTELPAYTAVEEADKSRT